MNSEIIEKQILALTSQYTSQYVTLHTMLNDIKKEEKENEERQKRLARVDTTAEKKVYGFVVAYANDCEVFLFSSEEDMLKRYNGWQDSPKYRVYKFTHTIK